MVSRLDFDKFYRFKDCFTDGTMAVSPINDVVNSKTAKELFLGDFSTIKPELFITSKNCKEKLCDMISAGAPAFYLFSDKVINALKENGITGWGAYPVTIRKKSGEEITNYYAFYVTGRAEKADRSLCEKIEVTYPNKTKGLRDKGYYFPLDSWDGSDFFYHIGTPFAISITEKVKNLLESINATNIDFIRCSEFIWP